MGDAQNIITLEAGWNQQIKVVALDPLEVCDMIMEKLLMLKITEFVPLFSFLQTMLEEGFKSKTRLFSNQEYAKVYT